MPFVSVVSRRWFQLCQGEPLCARSVRREGDRQERAMIVDAGSQHLRPTLCASAWSGMAEDQEGAGQQVPRHYPLVVGVVQHKLPVLFGIVERQHRSGRRQTRELVQQQSEGPLLTTGHRPARSPRVRRRGQSMKSLAASVATPPLHPRLRRGRKAGGATNTSILESRGRARRAARHPAMPRSCRWRCCTTSGTTKCCTRR